MKKSKRYRAFSLFFIIMLPVLMIFYNKQEPTVVASEIHVFEKQLPQPVMDSITFIPLQSDSSTLLGGSLRVKLYGNDIYVADMSIGGNMTIFRFNLSGQLLNKIGKAGHGPQEYPFVTDFLIHGDTVDILSGVGDQSKIYGFRKDGEFMYQKTIDRKGVSFEKYRDSYVIYNGYRKNVYKHRVYFTTADGKIGSKFLNDHANSSLPGGLCWMFKNNSAVYLSEFLGNHIYRLTPQGIHMAYTFDFGKYSVPESFFDSKWPAGFKELNKNGFAHMNSFYLSSKLAAFVIIVQKEGEKLKRINLYDDTAGHQLYEQQFIAEENSLFENLVSMRPDGQLVFLLYPSNLIAQKNQLEQLPVRYREVIDNLKESDNPVIMLCKLRTTK